MEKDLSAKSEIYQRKIHFIGEIKNISAKSQIISELQ